MKTTRLIILQLKLYQLQGQKRWRKSATVKIDKTALYVNDKTGTWAIYTSVPTKTQELNIS